MYDFHSLDTDAVGSYGVQTPYDNSDTAPVANDGGGVRSVIGQVRRFVSAPFIGPVDMVHLFLLTGLTIVFIGVWLMILAHVRAAASEIA